MSDDFGEKNVSPYKGSGLRFFGEKNFFRPRDLFCHTYSFLHSGHFRHTDEFGGNSFFSYKGSGLIIISQKFCYQTFSALFHIAQYFDMQEQFSIQKIHIRDVLDSEFFGEFCGL